MRIRTAIGLASCALVTVLSACTTTTAGTAVRGDTSASIGESVGGTDVSSGAEPSSSTGSSTGGSSSTGTSPASAAAPVDLTVIGEFGEKPEISFPVGDPPVGLEIRILDDGSLPSVGAEAVETGAVVVVNYLGQVWGADEPFDQSFDTGTAFDFVIGTQDVIAAWDEGLIGLRAGSRVLLTVPPELGYPEGNEAAGIEPTDVLVFVVDIEAVLTVDTFGHPANSSYEPPEDLPAGIEVIGEPGQAPVVSIVPGTPEPEEIVRTVVNFGGGANVVDGRVYLQFASYDWDGVLQGATWETTGPSKVDALAGIPELEGLIGLPVGSRVLLQLPADPAGTADAQPATVVVIDVIYQL